MKRFSIVAAVLLAFLATSAAMASVKPHALFSDGAVLQQGMSVPVWGTANDGEKVTVSFQNQKAVTTARDGKWMVRLNPLKAGGPYTMTISGENTIEIKNLLVGEVWVCSGQSNMEFTLRTASNADTAIANCKDPMLRLFNVPKRTSYTPTTDIDTTWQECNPDSVSWFTAVGYFFGRDLRNALKVPVGLIESAWGGTYAQTWTSNAMFESKPEYRDMLVQIKKGGDGPNRPTVLYNGMVHPLLPYAIRGAIWYQGEANAGEAYKYRTLFPDMITSWRNAWGQGDFPFLFVQLAPFMKIADQPEESAWAELREAQLLTSQHCPNTGMAVITDVGNPDDIHPKQKEPVGARLALLARKVAYKQKLVYSGPVYKSMKINGDSIILSFDSIGSGLMVKGDKLTGFAIAGPDKKFVWADAQIDGKRVVVKSPQVPNPVAVRYGWANCPVVNLYNKEGIPATPFRTDNFPGVTSPK